MWMSLGYDVPEEPVVNEESDMNEEDSQSLEDRSSLRVRVPKKRFTYDVPGVPTVRAIQDPHPIYFDSHYKQNNHFTKCIT